MTHTVNHTPGPWTVELDVDGFPLTVWSKHSPIAALENFLDGAQANAHLIAAAPELLEALEKIKGYLSGDTNQQLINMALGEAQYAIEKLDKAKGGN